MYRIRLLIFWFIYILGVGILCLTIDFVITKIFIKPDKVSIDVFPEKGIRIKHEIYHHTLKENSRVIEDNEKFGETEIITNSLGFRDKEERKIDYKKKKYRITFIGDSYTEGVLLDWKDTFVGLIENNLSKKNIEVLNAGVASYAPSIYYSKMNYYIKKFDFQTDELIVFIDITDIEDETLFYKLKDSKVTSSTNTMFCGNKLSCFIEKMKKKLNYNFYFSYMVLNFIYDYMNTFSSFDNKDFILSSKDHMRYNYTISNSTYNEYKNGILRSLSSMRLLTELCNANNIKLTIAVYPHITQIYYYDLNSKHVEIWKKFAKENNIKFLNLFPSFINNPKNRLLSEIDLIEKYFIPFDIHFNEYGNKLIAEYFLNNFN